MDYDIIEKASAAPEAASMIETFRAIGYNLETAIADIIDNSISAGAKNIRITPIWRGGNSIISIMDDGCGMDNEGIILAMRPGAQNPLSERSFDDLGRYGLGLKTASFSQCRKLSVLSKKKGCNTAYWTWDLDYVAQSDTWELLHWIPEEFKSSLDDVQSGTLVLWTDLDRILPLDTKEDNEAEKRKFIISLDRVKNHVAMIFHRFMEDKTVNLYWGSILIEPWNPFCPKEMKRQIGSTDYLFGGVEVKGFVLPHKKNFSSELAYNDAEGLNGWVAHQGFYVYRGKRLLLAGDWLGLFRKEEHYKLVRIQVDLPNTLDSEWQIDIKKSKATPPNNCKELLAAYAKRLRTDGREVYSHRARTIKARAGSNFQRLWLDKVKDGKTYFVINRDNDLIKGMKEMAKSEPSKAIDSLLRLIEEAIPTKTIYIKEAEGQVEQERPFSNIDQNVIRGTLEVMFSNLLNQGKTLEQARAYLKCIEPFNNYEELIEEL